MYTWNERRTVQLAMESTKDFVDRYIIVDKGSDDGTIEAIEECKDKWQLNVDVYVKPGLWLGEARLFAFNSADEEWILVQDGDEIFHTDGPNSIYNLRKFLKFQDVVYAAPMNVLCGTSCIQIKIYQDSRRTHFSTITTRPSISREGGTFLK
jgi:glycosyltransferase involved in cell wall biosynthesis